MHTEYYPSGNELFAARGNIVMAARAADVQCFDTVFTDFNDMEGFRRETLLIKRMGFDGNPSSRPSRSPSSTRSSPPSEKENNGGPARDRGDRVTMPEKGVGIFTLDGKMWISPLSKRPAHPRAGQSRRTLQRGH
jgi:citrate lyase subunit beta/citryl-CoA lyase